MLRCSGRCATSQNDQASTATPSPALKLEAALTVLRLQLSSRRSKQQGSNSSRRMVGDPGCGSSMGVRMPDTDITLDYPRAGYEQLLFKANGAGITVYSVAIATFLSGRDVKIPLVAFAPFWLYFFGLLFGFFVYSIGAQIIEDLWRRKKRREAIDLIEKSEPFHTHDAALETAYADCVKSIDLITSQLITPSRKIQLENTAAKLYLASGYCFIFGTFSALLCAMFAF